jgi:hypothetical protein
MAKQRSFNYQPPGKEALRERANMRGGGFDSFIKQEYKTYKAKDGKNVIRILPPTWEGAKYYGYDIFVNYNVGADNQSYLSLSKMKNHKDPLAEARVIAERDGDDELAKQLRPTQRVLMWIIDRSATDEGPLLWAAPFSKVAKAFVNLAFDEDTGKVLYIDDPEEGNDVRFYKTGSQLSTDYDASKMKLLEASPLNDDAEAQQAWLDYIQDNPVPDCLQFYDYKHIASVFNGAPAKAEPEGRAEPPSEDYQPAARRPRPEPGVPTEIRQGNGGDRLRRRAVQAEPEPAEDEPTPSGSISDRIRRRREEASPDKD